MLSQSGWTTHLVNRSFLGIQIMLELNFQHAAAAILIS